MNLRRSLSVPVPAIFDAAELLLQALDNHCSGDGAGAELCLHMANDAEVWAYTDQAWGKGAAARYGFIKVPGSPPYFQLSERPKPRMPGAEICKAVIARDGYHCRFCGIPVIHPDIRRLLARMYPRAVEWGRTNATQHAAFQCMWLQFDHILPNSRGGASSLDNVVIACAACNFGRMEATLDEARLMHPLKMAAPVLWRHHAVWNGLERFREFPNCPLPIS